MYITKYTLLCNICYTQNFRTLYHRIVFYPIYNVWKVPPFDKFYKIFRIYKEVLQLIGHFIMKLIK